MSLTDPLERKDLRVEAFDDALRLHGRGEVDDVAEPGVGDGNDGRRVAGYISKDGVEAVEVDGLTADLDEVDRPPAHPHDSSLDFAEVFREEPAVELRIDEAAFGRVSGE